MHQGQVPVIPAELDELRSILEEQWSARTAELLASGAPLAIDLDSMTDEQLREHAVSLGLTVADDAERASIVSAIKAKETPPPWGDDFDPDRAWRLVQNLRSDHEKVKSERDQLRDKVKEHEDATKTEQEKAAERAAEAERAAAAARTEALRLRVAMKKGLDETQAKRLVGETEEELEADADELIASFQAADASGDLPRSPRERLRPGAAPQAEPEETDPKKLADMVPRPYN